MTQDQVSVKLSISKNYYSMLETGVRTPGFKLAKRIADLYNTSIDEIFFTCSSNDMLDGGEVEDT